MSTDPGEADLAVVDVRFEHLPDALGIGVSQPRLSWRTETGRPDWMQAAYEIDVRDDSGSALWSTGWTKSGDSVLVRWTGAPLRSRQRCSARVRVRGADGDESPWSDPASVEAGLLSPEDWRARFISPDWDEDTTQSQPCPMLRREFHVRAGVRRARLYVSALGLYEIEVNGARAGDHVMAPGWTSYHQRLRYQTLDVTDLLRTGDNAIAALLADGWYRGRIGFGGGRRNVYGDRLGLLAQLEIAYEDGSTEIVATDESWRASTGPILASDIYDGETYDARLECPDWSQPGYDDASWSGVRVLDIDKRILVAPTGPPVRRVEVLSPAQLITSPSGATIIDFGQNLVGRLRLRVQGAAGTTLTIRHAEVLEDGELCTRPLRGAAATDRYVLMGGGVEEWEPRFTFHGFRYEQIDGWPGNLTPDSVSAVVCHSDMGRTGWFECSDPLINRLHENIVWSMRGNFLDVPTDCPQRDERLGWTGDIQVFAPTACFLYDTAGFLESWLRDLEAEQTETGVVPYVVPNPLDLPIIPTAAWTDAAVIVPWVLYQRYGDKGVLEKQYNSMRACVDSVSEIAGEARLWNKGFQFGDWLDPSAPPERPADARTDRYLVATAYFARSAELLSLAAGVLKLSDDEQRYARLAEEVREAFRREYVTPAGRVLSDAQTAYALTLAFDLIDDPDQRAHAAERLARLVRSAGYHIGTGFVGTPLICDALCANGMVEVAYRLLQEQTCPSWLYPVTMGSTTIWERWDSMLPDGSINPGQMTSFNHYAFGAIGDWLHRVVGGLAPAAPGYREIEIKPQPGGGLTFARSRHCTPYGPAEAGWRIEGSVLHVDALVPPNTTAVVSLPHAGAESFRVGSGRHHWTCASPVVVS